MILESSGGFVYLVFGGCMTPGDIVFWPSTTLRIVAAAYRVASASPTLSRRHDG